MKLRKWNLLAIAVVVLLVTVLPTWIVIVHNIKPADRAPPSDCVNEAVGAIATPGDLEQCREAAPVSGTYGWEEWIAIAAGILAACIVLYGLIWSAAWIAKWLRRG